MEIRSNNYILFLTIALFWSSLTGCSEYWWTRGQPPSTKELFVRANERISDSLKNKSSVRPELVANAIEVQKSLQILDSADLTTNDIVSSLKTLELSFKNLERNVSYGNRPPLNELSGQLRALEGEFKNGSNIEAERLSALRLFGARILMYLSTELNVPAPDPIT